MNDLLRSLVGDVDMFLRERWSREPVRRHARVSAPITEREIFDTVDCGLLSLPYFALLRDGRTLAPAELATTRTVLTAPVPGFVHRTNVMGHFEKGATIELPQVEDWHPASKALVDGLRPAFDGRVRASVYLAPEGGAAIRAADEGPHMFVVAAAGCSVWTIGAWDVLDEQLPLRSGEVLYVPNGWSYRATAVRGNSLLVVLTVEEPTVADIVDVVCTDLRQRIGAEPLASSHHLLRAAAKAGRVRDEIAGYCGAADVTALVGTAVELSISGARRGR